MTLGDKFEKYEEYFGKRKTTDNYLPIPTAAGRCTCPHCHFKPVPSHLPPNGAGSFREPEEWFEDVVRAYEG